MTIMFFGSDPWFSPPILEALMGAEHEIILVVTKGDVFENSKFRIPNSKIVQAKIAEDVSRSRLESLLVKLHPSAIILAAFGPPFLSNDVLNWPKHGSLNVHASLLPRWRGASPVFAAIAAGDKETGVSIMKMTEKIDRGSILGQKKLSIRQPGALKTDTRETLTKKLGILGGKLIVETLKNIENDQIKYFSQPEKSPTPYTRKLTKDSGRIDWSKSPLEIERFIRAVTPWPGATTSVEWKNEKGKMKTIEDIKILQATIFQLSTLNFQLIPILVQLPGKNPISWQAFLSGHPGAVLE